MRSDHCLNLSVLNSLKGDTALEQEILQESNMNVIHKRSLRFGLKTKKGLVVENKKKNQTFSAFRTISTEVEKKKSKSPRFFYPNKVEFNSTELLSSVLLLILHSLKLAQL